VSTIVVLAAGRGTRFGGSKQTSPVGPAGEWLLEYALYDAWRAGFTSAVVVVRPGAEVEFASLSGRVRERLTVRVVPQTTGLIPIAQECAPRPAPWGTAHAVLAARRVAEPGPVAVVNADDFYGEAAYRKAAAATHSAGATGTVTIVGMRLAQTLSPHGPVTRAICELDGDRFLRLEEVRGLEERDGRVVSAAGVPADPRALVSMNCWVLPEHLMGLLESAFRRFAEEPDAEGTELLLPSVIGDLATRGLLSVEVAEAPGPWFGLTHAADRPLVVDALRKLTREGVYPSPLW